jgi:hypothetical protein
MTPDDGVPLLQLVRERIASGHEADYDTIERAIAQACRALAAPHPYLALQNVNDPREIWWINRFASPAQRQQVVDAYAANVALMNEMGGLGARKASCVESSTDLLLRSSGPDHESHAALGHMACLVADWARDRGRTDVWTFDGNDGIQLAISPAESVPAARARADGLGPEAIVLAVVPAWSLPSPAWITANAALWRR